MTTTAHQIADRAVICDIECEGISTQLDGQCWYDVRPMLDPREVCDDVAEMNRQALGYAIARGLVGVHRDHPHLLRIIDKDVPA